MRELPEPDIRECISGKVIVGFTRDQVLAIQKQAYEDGLRDAPKGMALVPIKPTAAMLDAAAWSGAGYTWSGEVRKAWSAMLTASQKEQQ